MSPLDAAVFASLRDLSIETDGAARRVRGTMHFGDELIGPPGRVHGGIHPLVRTLPVLERLRERPEPITRLRIEASLLAGLPLNTDVAFEGRYQDGDDGFELTTRFLDTDRLRARATVPADLPLATEDVLERFRDLYERAQHEPPHSMRVIGLRYQIRPSLVWLDLRTLDSVDEDAHFRRAIDDEGSLSFAALSTQLDAVGATGRGARMRHPHFTKHLDLAFDLEGLEASTKLFVFADVTTIVEDEASEKVDVRGELYGSATAEVIAVDEGFRRCFGRGFVTSHPVDPARFAGFEGMRKLRRE